MRLLFYYMKRNVCHDEMAFCIHNTSKIMSAYFICQVTLLKNTRIND